MSKRSRQNQWEKEFHTLAPTPLASTRSAQGGTCRKRGVSVWNYSRCVEILPLPKLA
ncbi:MAG: hypothetical protein ACK480_14775 [Planctomycetota bacterium]